MDIRRLAAALFCATVLLISADAEAQGRAPIKVIAHPPDNGSKLPLYLGKEAGIFEKNGIQVSFHHPGSNEKLLEAMKTKEADIYVISVTHAISNKAAGAGDLVIVANTGYNYFRFLAEPSIAKAEDLKGKKVGTGDPGSTPDRITRLILTKLGLDPAKDVTLVPLGSGGRRRVESLTSGQVSAASVTSEGIFELEKTGQDKKFRVLTDYKKLNIYTGGGADYAVSPLFLRESRDRVKAFLRSICEAVALARKDKRRAIEILGKTMRITDPALLEFVHRIYVGEVIPERPYPRLESMELGIQMTLSRLDAKGIKAQDLMDLSLIQELENEGLFKQLYQ